MSDDTDDSSLFAECLQAEVTYGTQLPCERFAPPEENSNLWGGAVEEQGAANHNPYRYGGGRR